ncbi:MAG: hypothetical protein PHC30_11485, partial [Lentisphaeria bacterium]|nr:hypothetical protein [Lentisphaeria bacterium]
TAIEQAPAPEGEVMRFRGSHQLQVSPDASGRLSVELFNKQVGKSEAMVTYRLLKLGAVMLLTGDLTVNTGAVLEKNGLAPRSYALEINSGSNSVIVRNSSGMCLVAASQSQPLHLIEDCPRLYFQVLGDNREVELVVQGAPSLEHVAVTVWDGDGAVVAEDSTVGKPKHVCKLVIPVADGQQGRLWSLRLGKAGDLGYEDMTLILARGAEPVVADRPERLALPLLQQESLSVDKKHSLVGYRFSQRLLEVPGVQAVLDFTFTDGSGRSPLQKQWAGAPSMNSACHFEFGFGDLVLGQLRADVRDGQGKTIAARNDKGAVCRGEMYHEIEWLENHEPAPAGPADVARGFQVFQRQEPGDVRPNSRPRSEELVREIADAMAPGCWSVQFFALYPLRDARQVRLAVSDLSGPDGARIAGDSIELRVVRTWPQLTDWNASTYHVIPEMLEEKASFDLTARLPQQLALRIPIPAGAVPGWYRGAVSGPVGEAVQVAVRVLPYALPEVRGMTWGLYCDPIRWKIYSDDEIRHEMRLFREQGFNALMMYPLYDAVLTWENGVLGVDFGRFRDYMRLYQEIGFDGVAVMSIQGMEGALKRGMKLDQVEYNDDFRQAFGDFLAALRRLGEEDGWPEYCVHTVDEPNARHGAEEATRTLRLVKEAGFETFNTCYGAFVREVLDPWLDYRCYNNVGYGSTPNEAATTALREETLAAGDKFWQYATGCYTNSNLIEDGNIYSNRHLGGVLVWRAQFTGSYTWTLLRAKNDPYNDFDGWGHGERKEACTVYPTPDRKGIIPTLQWEGIREGIYDHRFLTVLDGMIKAALASADPAVRARGEKAGQAREEMWKTIGWTCRNGAVTNAHLRATRARVIELIDSLR